MKIYDKVIQGTDEWKELRHGKVGGSTIAKLMSYPEKSIRNCTEYYSVLAENIEEFDPFIENRITFEMQRGNDLEPLARQEFERISGKKAFQVGWVEMDNGFVGISPDGIINEKHNIEIKCPSANTHMMYILDNSVFTEKYAWQIVHNFYTMAIERLTCISYRPENELCPLLAFDVTNDTVIKISSKVSKTVAELCLMIHLRVLELQECINDDLNKITNKNKF